LLHQGSQTAPADFIAVARGTGELPPHQEILLANCLAQSQALAFGKSQEQALAEMLAGGMDAGDAARLAPYRAFPGNRPSTTILLESLSPAALGALIALYEHRVFVQAVVLNSGNSSPAASCPPWSRVGPDRRSTPRPGGWSMRC
jgi:glucose-6-phosphate isomerase